MSQHRYLFTKQELTFNLERIKTCFCTLNRGKTNQYETKESCNLHFRTAVWKFKYLEEDKVDGNVFTFSFLQDRETRPHDASVLQSKRKREIRGITRAHVETPSQQICCSPGSIIFKRASPLWSLLDAGGTVFDGFGNGLKSHVLDCRGHCVSGGERIDLRFVLSLIESVFSERRQQARGNLSSLCTENMHPTDSSERSVREFLSSLRWATSNQRYPLVGREIPNADRGPWVKWSRTQPIPPCSSHTRAPKSNPSSPSVFGSYRTRVADNLSSPHKNLSMFDGEGRQNSSPASSRVQNASKRYDPLWRSLFHERNKTPTKERAMDSHRKGRAADLIRHHLASTENRSNQRLAMSARNTAIVFRDAKESVLSRTQPTETSKRSSVSKHRRVLTIGLSPTITWCIRATQGPLSYWSVSREASPTSELCTTVPPSPIKTLTEAHL